MNKNRMHQTVHPIFLIILFSHHRNEMRQKTISQLFTERYENNEGNSTKKAYRHIRKTVDSAQIKVTLKLVNFTAVVINKRFFDVQYAFGNIMISREKVGAYVIHDRVLKHITVHQGRENPFEKLPKRSKSKTESRTEHKICGEIFSVVSFEKSVHQREAERCKNESGDGMKYGVKTGNANVKIVAAAEYSAHGDRKDYYQENV